MNESVALGSWKSSNEFDLIHGLYGIYPTFQNYYKSIPIDLKADECDEYMDYLSWMNREQQLNNGLDFDKNEWQQWK